MSELPEEKLPVDIAIDDLPTHIKVRAIALMISQRHHDTATIKDAAMYQTLKMQSDNAIVPLSDNNVIRTALKFERYLLGEFSKDIVREVIEEAAKDATDAIIAAEQDGAGHERRSRTA